MQTKQSLRPNLIAQRQALSPEQWQHSSAAVIPWLKNCSWFQSAKVVFAYRSFRQEIALDALYKTTRPSHTWAFPRCEGKEMVWHQWAGQAEEDFTVSAYGIQEPQETWPILDRADLILIPTVACDRQGFRLGYGGGYYDRMLATLPSSTRTIGILFDQFLLDELPIDEWDQPLDALCSESGFFPIP